MVKKKIIITSGTKKQSYVCSTCGQTAGKRGHLCAPVAADTVVQCEWCGQAVADARHVCQPKVEKLSYACEACGRVAVKKNEVCRPKKIV